jgi:hypothetical protein
MLSRTFCWIVDYPFLTPVFSLGCPANIQRVSPLQCPLVWLLPRLFATVPVI